MKKNNKRISRITGKPIDKNLKSLLEDPSPENPNWKAFGLMAEAFRLNTSIQDKNPLKYLYQEWNFPKSFIKELFELMGSSFDETNWFLNKLDGEDSLQMTWESYVVENNINDGFPFKFDTIEEYE